MVTVGADMDYYGGFNGQMADHGRELIGAAYLAKEWADGIEKEMRERHEGNSECVIRNLI